MLFLPSSVQCIYKWISHTMYNLHRAASVGKSN